MALEIYEIDPDGDVLLILQSRKTPFAVWDETRDGLSSRPKPASLNIVDEILITESTITKKDKKKQKRALNTRPVPMHEVPSEPFDEPLLAPPEFYNESHSEPFNGSPLESFDEPPSTSFDGVPAAGNEHLMPLNEPTMPPDESLVPIECAKIRVSSHHLSLASPYYSRMSKGEFKEANTLRHKGSVKVEIEDLDVDALVLLMKMIHGKTRTVPRTIALEMLAKIAVIVDSYECHEAIEVFTDMWIAHLRGDLPSVLSRDAVLWICISQVFSQHDEFRSVTSVALKDCSVLIQDLGLPIQQTYSVSVVQSQHSYRAENFADAIAQRREESINMISVALRQLAKDLLEDSYGCSSKCRCTILGTLIKAINTQNLPFSHSFTDSSLAEMKNRLGTVRSLGLCLIVQSEYYPQPADDCGLEYRIDLILASLEDLMTGLTLEDFPARYLT